MLGAKYGIYRNAAKDLFTVHTTEYRLPKTVHSGIAMIQPTTMFSDMNMFNDRAKTTLLLANPGTTGPLQTGCDSGITPLCIQSL